MIALPIQQSETILKLIPQRSPFVLVDTLVDFSEQTLTALFSPDESCILVENRILSASGLLEHQAQSVALHTGYAYALRGLQAPLGYIGAIKKTHIETLPVIGNTIRTEVSILNEFMGVSLVKICSFIGDKTISVTEMKTVVKEENE